MHFTEAERELASQLKEAGLEWLKDWEWIVVAFFDLEGSVDLRITKEEKENPSQALGIEFDTITILESATDLSACAKADREAMYKALLEAQGKNKMEVLQ